MDKVKDICISTLIILLTVAIALIAFVLATISLPTVFQLLKHGIGSPTYYFLLDHNRLTFIPYFVVSIAVFTALLTYLREKNKLHNEKQANQSKIFLQLAKEGLEGAYDMLKDQNNNRVTWVRAARDILHSLNLAKEIKTSQYVEAYRLFEEKIRHKLYLAITVKDEKTGDRQALPPQFFYGVANWMDEQPLDELAKETSSGFKVGDLSIDHNREVPHLTPLSVKSVVAIFNFMEYPTDYDDPLKKIVLWDNGWADSNGVFQGAIRFVSHYTNHTAFNGKLYPKKEAPTANQSNKGR